MTNRFPHILRGNKSGQQPNNCIWVDTETKFTTTSDGRQHHYLKFGWACYQRREEGDLWSIPDWFRFTDTTVFWDWLLQRTRDKTRLYLFAHNGAFDLPVLQAFTALPAKGYRLVSAIADAPPLILTWKSGNRTIKFVDTLNIWRLPLEKVGESIGSTKMPMPPTSASKKRWDEYCKQDVEIIRKVTLSWFTFLRDNDLGGFSPTLASQSFNAYRHRFMPHPIFITDKQSALDIERKSYLGGRTECFKMGKHEGDFYLLDINSQYPSVMFAEEYPHRLLGVYGNVDFKELERWLENKAVIGEVDLNTNEAVYPVVLGGKLTFPVGRFTCTLAGPELSHAIQHNHIVSIGKCAVYKKAKLFEAYIAFMYTKRLEARAAGDVVNTWLYKIMMNSLYGKFGQRGRCYEKVGECDPNEVGVWSSIDAETREVTHYRKFGGIVQEWIEEGESRESFPGIASYVTSYARLVLHRAIVTAGRSNCYYCDTDSLVVNRVGYNKLSDELDDNELGKWSLVKRLSTLVINGPKDYIFDDDKKVKGIRRNAEWPIESIASQDYFVGFKALVRSGNLDGPIVYKINKVNVRQYDKGVIDDNYDVLPIRLDN